MADNDETATVLQFIPRHLLSETDLEILGAYGFSTAPEKNDTLYLCAENGVGPGDWFRVDDKATFLRQVEQDYPECGHRPAWVTTLVQGIAASNPNRSDVNLNLEDMGISHKDVFQGLFNKGENAKGENDLEFIEIIAGHWCSKACPGELGGWVARIDRDAVQVLGASRLLDMMGKGGVIAKNDVDELVDAAKKVIARWESGELACAVRDLSFALGQFE